jgi:hypothetical protein
MVNGIPGKPILACQGLRQGDPLSPMIFILCMEPLRAMFKYAAERGLLAPLERSGLHQRVSMFADDVVVFFKPNELETSTCAAILGLFGQASGLEVNMSKSAVLPIRCSQEEMELVSTSLGCANSPFPCKYLGLPLTIRKQSAAQLQSLVDRVADCLPLWKAAMLPKSGRLLLIQSVLCAIPVHAMMALDLLARTLSALVKICRGFLWCRKKEARGGNCSVAWDVVCTPKWAGGLGLPNIHWMNKALQAPWPWLQKFDKGKTWVEFSISVPSESLALVQAVARTMMGDGKSTLFWEDRWMDGYRICEIAPAIYDRIPQRVRHTKLVSDALRDNNWTLDIGPNLAHEALEQFLVAANPRYAVNSWD